MAQEYDVVVLGSGPAGYPCAIRASQLGLKVAIVEKEQLGGVCLNVGCIPSKALISAAKFYHKMLHDAKKMGFIVQGADLNWNQLIQWKESVSQRMRQGVQTLLKGNHVEVFSGLGYITGSNTLEVTDQSQKKIELRFKNLVIATGSEPVTIPGFEFDGVNVLNSTHVLSLGAKPSQLVVIGAGYIGLELSMALAQLGVKVTILEAGKSILGSVVDPECAQVVTRRLEHLGIKLILNAKAKRWEQKGVGKLVVYYEQGGSIFEVEGEKILVTIGRRPISKGIGLENLGIPVNDQGFIVTDAQRRTQLNHVYAVGDVAGQPMLAHKGTFEGIMVAHVIKGENRVWDFKAIPAVVFTDPELASVGLTLEEAKKQGYYAKEVKFPFAANGRAVSLMETDGFVKIVYDAQREWVLGVHMVGPEVSQLISEAALAIEMGACLTDLAATIHPHPTLSETIMEAAEVGLGHPIHILMSRKNHG